MDKKTENLKLAQDQLKLSLETTQEFFDMWTKNYQSAIGKLAQVPAFGPIREKQEKIMKSLPLYTNLYTSWVDSTINFQSVLTEAMKRTYEKTIDQWPKISEDIKNDNECIGPEKFKEYISPEKFKELYKIWIDTYSETIKEFTKSEHFSSDMGKLSSVLMDFQKFNREIIEENYLKPNNLPTKTDIDGINKEIYDLKKIVKDLTKDIRELSKPTKIEQSVETEQSGKIEQLGKTAYPGKNKQSEKKEILTK